MVTQVTVDGKAYRGLRTLDLGPQGKEDLVLSLEPGVELSGAVTVEPKGTCPHGQAIVVLAPEGKFRHVTSFYRLASADEQGHFEIKAVAPGSYVAFAFELERSPSGADLDLAGTLIGMAMPGFELTGTLPTEFQHRQVYAAAIIRGFETS